MKVRKGSIKPLNVNPGFLPRLFVECLAHSYRALPHLLPISAESSAMVNMARTQNGKKFLDSEAEWALLIDSDMTWNPDAIIRLSKTAKEKKAKVVSGLTFMEQKERIVPHAYQFIPDGKGGKILAPYAVLPTWDEPFTVEAAGGACLLVHRDVYEDVRKLTQGITAYHWQEDVYMPNADAQQGEDITFSKRVRKAGYEIWYEPRALFPHTAKTALLGYKEYAEFLSSLQDQTDANLYSSDETRAA